MNTNLNISPLVMNMTDSNFYEKTSLETLLQGLKESLEVYTENNFYPIILREAVYHNRLDLFEHIFESCEKNEYIYKHIKEIILPQAFMSNKESIIEFLLIKNVPIENMEKKIRYCLPEFSLSLLKKIQKVYNLTEPKINALTLIWNEWPTKFENIDYLLDLGLKIEDNYTDISRLCFNAPTEENKRKIDYLIKKEIDLNRNDNMLLMFAIQCGEMETLEYLMDKKIDLKLPDKCVSHAFGPYIAKDNIFMIDYMVKKGLKFNINSSEFIEWVASEDAMNILKYCIPLGIDMKEVKKFAGPITKEYLISQLYSKVNNEVEEKKQVGKTLKSKI